MAVFEEWARNRGCTEAASDCDLENQTSYWSHLTTGFHEVGRLIHFRKLLD